MLRLTCIFSLFLVVDSAAQQPSVPKPRNDQELVQGNWDIVGLESNGKSESSANYKGNRFSFAKEKAILKEGNYTPIEYTFSLDASKSPRAIDLTVKGTTLRGIYKLENEELILCISMGKARPTDFATKASGDCEIITLKRSRWEKYTDKTFGFAVELPGKPEERKLKMETALGQLPATFLIVRGENDRVNVNFMVSVVQLPRKMEEREKELDETMETLKKTMLSEFALTQNPMPKTNPEFRLNFSGGRDWTIPDLTAAMDKVTARIRFFVDGGKLYGLMGTGGEDPTQRRSGVEDLTQRRLASLFWNSFEAQQKP